VTRTGAKSKAAHNWRDGRKGNAVMKYQWTWSDIKLLADIKEAGVRLPRLPKRIKARVQRELELRTERRRAARQRTLLLTGRGDAAERLKL
jgi:hypothetical protein